MTAETFKELRRFLAVTAVVLLGLIVYSLLSQSYVSDDTYPEQAGLLGKILYNASIWHDFIFLVASFGLGQRALVLYFQLGRERVKSDRDDK
jgi:hypothetical protein